MEHAKPRRIKLRNTPERPLSEREIVDATLAFANGDSLEIMGLVPNSPHNRAVGDEYIKGQIKFGQFLRGKKIAGFDFSNDDDFVKTAEEYGDRVRQKARNTISLYLKHPLDTSSAVLKTPLAENINDIVRLKVVLHSVPDGVVLDNYYEFTTAYDLVELGVLLLIDKVRAFSKKVCQCQWEPCAQFFFEVKPPIGRPQRRYCCSEHMLKAHDQNAAERMKKRRRAPAGKK